MSRDVGDGSDDLVFDYEFYLNGRIKFCLWKLSSFIFTYGRCSLDNLTIVFN